MQFNEMIPLYINGQLNYKERYLLIKHFAACDSCMEEYLTLKKAAYIINENSPRIPSELSDGIYNFVKTEIEKEETKPFSEYSFCELPLNPIRLINKTLLFISCSIEKSLIENKYILKGGY